MNTVESIKELLKENTVEHLIAMLKDKNAEWNEPKTIALKGHTHAVNSVAYSPDGKRLLTGSGDKTAKVWDANTGQEVLTIKHDYYIYSVTFSPDNKKVVSADSGGFIKITTLP